MPHSDKIKEVDIPSIVFWGERPETKFLDYLDCIKVSLLNWPNKKLLYKVMYNFQRATWGYKGRKDEGIEWSKIQQSIEEMSKGKSLGLGMEAANFTFLVEGISRIITHQIVRTRVGVTYSQRCTGDQDLRYDNFMVPRSYNKIENRELLQRYKKLILEAKQLYADSLDSGVPITDARYCLPPGNMNYIYVHISLSTLIPLIGKRMCTNETIEYNEVSSQMRNEVIKKFPLLENVLMADCDKPSKCFFARGHSPLNGNIFTPDEKHEFEYNKWNFMYPRSRHQMIGNTKFKEDGKKGEFSYTIYDKKKKKWIGYSLIDQKINLKDNEWLKESYDYRKTEIKKRSEEIRKGSR